jgi:hypothetical protein
MPDNTDKREKATEPEREGTYQSIVHALGKNPAYLLLFSLGLLGGGMGVGTTVIGFYHENTTFMILGFASWALLVVASLSVILYVERPRQRSTSLLDFLDDKARAAFHSGGVAKELSGEWQVTWYAGTGDGRKPNPGDAQDMISVSTFGSGLVGVAKDDSTKKRYWLLGRISTRHYLPLLYWSQSETEMLTGVVFMHQEEVALGAPLRMKGIWEGYTRDGQVTRGECEWNQQTT